MNPLRSELEPTPTRAHLARLMKVWRSGGWPCRDAIEIDLLAAKWVALSVASSGHETLRLTDLGIRWLAQARRAMQRAASDHDRLAQRMARQLAQSGRIVWRELTLRTQVGAEPSSAPELAPGAANEALWSSADEGAAAPPQSQTSRVWRVARPDVFSLRNTSVQNYLQPMVHEVKVSRADLLCDLRHAAKRESYQWLSCETYYVFPAPLAEVQEIPQDFGVWILNGTIDEGSLELVRPARHTPCTLPFAVWMVLAKSTPEQFDNDTAQGHLGGPVGDAPGDAPAGVPGDAPPQA